METRERRPLDPSERPTQPRVRLPLPTLPTALPAIPWLVGRVGDEGGHPVFGGALPDGELRARRGVWHGGR